MKKQKINTFSELYTMFYRRSFLFSKSYVHDDLAAEDITSESLIKLWETIKKEEVASPKALLLSILRNKSLDYLKHELIKQETYTHITDLHKQDLDLRVATLTACDPEEIFSDEIQHIIQRTLASLPEQTRKIFELSRIENKSNKEIADIYSISVKGVDYHIAKALKALRTELKDYLPILYFFFYFN